VVVPYFWHLMIVLLNTNASLRAALKEQQVASRLPVAEANPRDMQRLQRLVFYCAVVRIGTCLLRSLAAWRFLRSRGVPAKVIIAPSSSGDEPFSAHAWIEVDGGYIIGDALSSVEVFRYNSVVRSRQA
jgi:hypothetical protein